jgi:formylglycine-generating enzyme required for sulfatase activity
MKTVIIGMISICCLMFNYTPIDAQEIVAMPWTIPVTIFCDSISYTLNFGAKTAATDGFDYGTDVLAPPLPPSGYSCYFEISGLFTNLKDDYRLAAKSPNSWTLRITKTEGASGAIFWNPVNFPLGDVPGSLTISGMNMFRQNSMQFTGDQTLTINYSAPQKSMLYDQMAFIPGGAFDMGDVNGNGSTVEKPVHQVTLNSFYISKTEVTNSQYAQFLNAYGSEGVKSGEYAGESIILVNGTGITKNGGAWQPVTGMENHPAVNVTWYGANEFCRFYNYRLPTEAEWEYAARSGGENEKWAGTSDNAQLIDYAWYGATATATTHEIASKKPNGLGLYDMSGNVWEWCSDWYDANYYSVSPAKNPQGPVSGSERVIRGGSFGDNNNNVRTMNRGVSNPGYRFNGFGFRVAKSVDPNSPSYLIPRMSNQHQPSLNSGDEWFVDIILGDLMHPVTNLWAISATIDFSASHGLIEAVEESAGDFFGPDVIFSANHDNVGDSLNITVYRPLETVGVNGTGILARVKFRNKKTIPSSDLIMLGTRNIQAIDPVSVPILVLGSIIVVPVELSMFTANVADNIVQLKWRTESETNNYGFEIEKMTTSGWKNIGFVTGWGTIAFPHDYSFSDRNAQPGKTSYRLKQIDTDGKYYFSQTVCIEINEMPNSFSLLQNYPNPFNPTTTIEFSLAAEEHVSIKVYSLLGDEVAILIDDQLPAGMHKAVWNAGSLANGVYYYILKAGKYKEVRKAVLME